MAEQLECFFFHAQGSGEIAGADENVREIIEVRGDTAIVIRTPLNAQCFLEKLARSRHLAPRRDREW
jgi:hypothetical protein